MRLIDILSECVNGCRMYFMDDLFVGDNFFMDFFLVSIDLFDPFLSVQCFVS